MSSDWHHDYNALVGFIRDHPEIEIGIHKTRIPDSIRGEFYYLFDKTLSGYVDSLNAELVVMSAFLGERYQEVLHNLANSANIKVISSPSTTRFTINPFHEVVNSIFEVLWDLLKEKITVDAFSTSATKKIDQTIGPLFIEAYQQWILLVLLVLLDCADIQQVILGDLSRYEVHKYQLSIGDVPAPASLTNIMFNHESAVKFIVPNVIAYSVKLEKYCAFRLGANRPLLKASDLSPTREWVSLPKTGKVVRDNQAFVYLGNTPENIKLVADTQYMCKPDAILEFLVGNEAGLSEIITRIKNQHDSLGPPAGTFVVFANKIPDTLQLNNKGIHILEVGFDQSKLQPVVTNLVGCQSSYIRIR